MSRNATATATGTAVVAKSAGAEAGAGAGPHSPSARTWIPISAAFVVVAVAFCLTHTTFLSYNKGMPPSSPPPPPVPCSSRSSPCRVFTAYQTATATASVHRRVDDDNFYSPIIFSDAAFWHSQTQYSME